MVSTIYKQVLRGQSNRDSFSGRANHIDFCPRYNSKEDNKMKLTNKEKTMIFEIARVAYEGCGMWLSSLVYDNYSWFTPMEMVKRLNWSKEKVAGVMSSLFEKNIIGSENTASWVGFENRSCEYYLNLPSEKDKSNKLYNFLKENELSHSEYCNNIFINNSKEDK